jgi:Rap1a immunity proteins
MRLIFAVILIGIWSSFARGEEDRSSGALYAPYCKSLLMAPKDVFMEGMCLGVLQGMSGVARALPADIRSCQPPGNPYKDLLAVVVRFLDAHPERLHESFGKLALEALREAYPCQ